MKEPARRNFFGPKAGADPAAVPQLETVKTLAQKICLSEWAIYELVRRGQIPYIRVGGKLLFHPAKICAWLEERSSDMLGDRRHHQDDHPPA